MYLSKNLLGCMLLVGNLVFALGCIFAAKRLHMYLLQSCLHWPMSLYDTSPIGRILNRFSNDVNVLDNALPQLLLACLMTSLSVIINGSFPNFTPSFCVIVVSGDIQ